MSEQVVKEVQIIKRKGKYCVISCKKDQTGSRHSFGCYNTKEQAKERLSHIYILKNKKSEIISILHEVSGTLYNLGMIHIADALIGCVSYIIQEEPKNQVAVKVGKIITLLQRRGEMNFAEKLETLLPEILVLEKTGCSDFIENPFKHRISAQRAFNIVSLLNKKYLEGEIEENDFEYAKMKELESLLKAGFIFPKPQSYKEIPIDAKNWWDHFSKR